MTKQTRRGRKPVEKHPKWIAFGQRLVDLRIQRKLRGLDVARLADINPATYSRIENGERSTGPDHETLKNLADLYGMTIDELLGERPTDHHDEKTQRDVFPRADVGPPAGPAPLELTHIRAAVHDAVFAAITDVFEAVASARARTAAIASGEAGRAVPAASAEQRRSGTAGR